MGNKLNTNVTSGVKAQAAGDTAFYRLINLGGGGELVELMRKANRTKNYEELDTRMREGFKEFMYNNGQGKIIHIRELVLARCRDKGVHLDVKNNNLDVNDMEAMTDDDSDYLKKHGCQYKKVCWKLDQRGGVGETPLHVCLLNGSSLLADLSKRMLRIYPELMCDIYTSDEYYGENMLHMAIVNEDPAMVKYLLDNGVDYHQRACGNFFTADDQKDKRRDNIDHEWLDLPVESNYEGYTYWGEFPLGFAACLGQEECVRLLIAKGADPNLLDSNGNTILHMLVIHDNKEMFDLLISLGAKLHIKNQQGLTPLTLSAKLARKDMYEHILEIDREVYWIYGTVTCAGYPLEHIDTISETGEINTTSTMYHVVYGDKRNHLDMIDGVISYLLHEKWKTFAKYRFLRRFAAFIAYFTIFMVAFYLRPGTDNYPDIHQENRTLNGTIVTINVTVKDPCYLLKVNKTVDVIRLVAEVMTLFGATWYLFLSLKEIYHQGYRIFFQTLISSPSKALFMLATCFVLTMVPGRASCAYVYEDVMGVLAVLCTAPYFLFFCRGFKIVGPFVVMIYTMIRTDLLRFFTIYLIFVIGFSQAMYVIFRGVDSNIFHHPVESMMGMFIMSLGEFADIYESFQYTAYPILPTLIFVVYMILVTLLLVNMLIAMMGNTYQLVNETQKEWLRQWAKIILVVEQTVTTDERRNQQLNYSQPMPDGRRALVIRWHQSEREQEQLQRLKEEFKVKQRTLMQRKQDLRQLHHQLHSTQLPRPAKKRRGIAQDVFLPGEPLRNKHAVRQNSYL